MSLDRQAARTLIESNIRLALREAHICAVDDQARLDTVTEHVLWHLEQRWCREALGVLAREE